MPKELELDVDFILGEVQRAQDPDIGGAICPPTGAKVSKPFQDNQISRDEFLMAPSAALGMAEKLGSLEIVKGGCVVAILSCPGAPNFGGDEVQTSEPNRPLPDDAQLRIARGALQHIKGYLGQVCEEYETCQHQTCAASSGAWLTADVALGQMEGRYCPTCSGPPESAFGCSNAFHLCRKCCYQEGKLIEVCLDCQSKGDG